MTEDADTRWTKTVELFMSCQWSDLPAPMLGKNCGLGVVLHPHRLFRPGDVVIMNYWNGGGERQLVFCRTQRGYNVRMYYLPYRRYKRRIVNGCRVDDVTYPSTMNHVELPDELMGKPLADPAVRRFVVEYLAREGCRESDKRE